MTLTPVCNPYKLIIGESVTVAGYTFKYIKPNWGNSIMCLVWDPAGQLIAGISETEPAVFFFGGVATYPVSGTPIVTFKLIGLLDETVGYLYRQAADMVICTYIDDTVSNPPPTTPPTTPPDDGILKPAPLPPELKPLDTSGFYAFFLSIYDNIISLLNYISSMISWIGDSIASVFRSIAALLSYFISLKWITDFSKQFFTDLDVWLSNKFGIDPALPFWEELVKKAIGWLGGGIDEAAGKAIERLK